MKSVKRETYSVGELTHYIKFLLEQDRTLQDVWVSGEISNLTKHGSGHVYFTLKDKDAALTTVMFRGTAAKYPVLPGNGDKVQLRGDITVYPPRGNYQLIVRELKRAGLGDLHQAFLALKARLQAEGLFDPLHKQPTPKFPRKIGIVTSPTGAVIRDIINTVKRRFPHVELVLAPTHVQGEKGKDSIIHSLDLLQRLGGVDLILLCRGGGSLEDLWPFNEEAVARAVFGSKIPVISGVGHETDFTIADFVADRRASTPTAAAELAVPDVREIRQQLDGAALQLQRSLQNYIDFGAQRLDDYASRLSTAIRNKIETARRELELQEVKVASLDIHNTLERGFSITRIGKKPVLDAAQLQTGDAIETIYHKGKSRSTVESTEAK